MKTQLILLFPNPFPDRIGASLLSARDRAESLAIPVAMKTPPGLPSMFQLQRLLQGQSCSVEELAHEEEL